MENQIIIEATKETPYISFDKLAGEMIIKGRSMPEDAFEFYQPVIKWLESYVDAPSNATTFTINLDYFNSGSVKQVFTMLCILEEILNGGKSIRIIWNYAKGDELMQSKGSEFNKFLDVDLELIEL